MILSLNSSRQGALKVIVLVTNEHCVHAPGLDCGRAMMMTMTRSYTWKDYEHVCMQGHAICKKVY